MNARTIVSAWAVLATLVLAGCATGGARPELGPDDDEPIEIVIENRLFATVTVFAIRGTRHRLGQVSAQSTDRFRLPFRVVAGQTLRLVADPLGSSRVYRSGPIRIDGDEGEIVWTIIGS